MKVADYNPKAREAYGRSLVDIGVSIYKAIMLFVTVIPASAIVKSGYEGNSKESSFFEPFINLSDASFNTLVGLLAIAFFAAHMFRRTGLRYIHESDENQP